MQSAREKYLKDPIFHSLVDLMVHHIVEARFTPSEMREAAILASIIYEGQNVRSFRVPEDINSALQTLRDWADRPRAIMTWPDGEEFDYTP